MLSALSILFDKVVELIKSNWSALAVMFWNYEETRVLNQKIEKDQADLKAEEKTNEMDVLKKYAGMDPDGVLASFSAEGALLADPNPEWESKANAPDPAPGGHDPEPENLPDPSSEQKPAPLEGDHGGEAQAEPEHEVGQKDDRSKAD